MARVGVIKHKKAYKGKHRVTGVHVYVNLTRGDKNGQYFARACIRGGAPEVRSRRTGHSHTRCGSSYDTVSVTPTQAVRRALYSLATKLK